jgi:hypothetical protein
MSSDVFMLEGRADSWRALRAMRREQLEARRKAQPAEPALFPLKDDHGPATERTAAQRYAEPSRFATAPAAPGRRTLSPHPTLGRPSSRFFPTGFATIFWPTASATSSAAQPATPTWIIARSSGCSVPGARRSGS